MAFPPLRVAVVETSPYGGLLHYATQLADALADRGMQVDLLACRGHELETRPGAARRVGLFPPTSRSTQAPSGRLRYLVRRVGIAARLAWALARVTHRLASGRYDAAVLQWDLSMGIGRAAGRRLVGDARRPVTAYVLHNVRPLNLVAEGTNGPARRRSRVAAVLAGFDLLFVHGQRSLADYEQTWPSADVVVIPHGDQTVFATDPPTPAAGQGILFFGDWRRVKGLLVLLEAFDLLRATHPCAHLTIAGNPVPSDLDDRPIRTFAAQRPDAVRLVGHYVPMDQVPALFAGARVVVIPYLAGYQSGVVHLAMTMARAVVATDVGDLSATVVDGTSGLVVPPGDAAALAAALGAMLDDPERTDAMGAAAWLQLRSDATWATVAEIVERALRRSLDSRGGDQGWTPGGLA